MQLYFNNLSKSYGDSKIFECISGKINQGDKIGIVGLNGVGKTTLCNILCGKETADEGIVKVSSSLKIVYIEENPKFDNDISVYDELYETAKICTTNEKKLKTVVDKALNTVKLSSKMSKMNVKKLSGGEKTKVLLAKILVSEYDLLILDEPTNHLDIESCKWLEEYLNNLNKSLLVISHDRFFLDNVANKIWEIKNKTLKEYKGNYSDYKVEKDNELKNIMKEYTKQQDKIKSLKSIINDRTNWYASAHKSAGQNDFLRAKAKKHASVLKAKKRELQKLEENKIIKPKEEIAPMFKLINKNIINKKLPSVLISCNDICKSYGEKVILKNSKFQVNNGDKVAIIGENGCGKTTLLKIIQGIDKDYQGEVKVNPSINIGYFSQELSELKLENTVIEEVLLNDISSSEARMFLASLIFKGDDVKKKIKELSMGEKCRVAFAKLILGKSNILILDEPTNYMDIVSKEALENVLCQFQGTIIFVSHDRYFIRKIANKIIEIKDKKLKVYNGNYDYYIEKNNEEYTKQEVGMEYNNIKNKLQVLEYELAFLSGKLSEPLEEKEKKQLTDKFIKISQEIRNIKN